MKQLSRYLIGAVALIVMATACTSNTTRASSPSTVTTNSLPVTTTTRSAGGLTAEQVDAHEGAGVPAGWDPVDAGSARVWVPKDWILESEGACIGDPSAAGMISIGDLPQAGCDPPVQYPTPKQAVALIPSSQATSGQPVLTVHGYRIYNGNPLRHVGPWNSYLVPQLGVRIAIQGTLSRRVLGTLAPSARRVALVFLNEAVPSGWHAVVENGVSLSIPPTWTVATPNFFCGSPVSDSTLLLVKPDIGAAPCPAPAPTPAGALHDGLSFYLPPDNRYAPRPTGRPVATLRHGTTTVAVYAEAGVEYALDLIVRRAGTSITHVLTLGLSRDGRVAAGVLASIGTTR